MNLLCRFSLPIDGDEFNFNQDGKSPYKYRREKSVCSLFCLSTCHFQRKEDMYYNNCVYFLIFAKLLNSTFQMKIYGQEKK